VTQRFIISWAQNASPHHPGFLASLRKFTGTLLVIKGRYKNPTSIFIDPDQDDDSWYAPELVPFLVESRIQLCPNLCLYGDIKTQPTAARPLSGFEVFCGQNSGIMGHPKRALDVVPSATRMPRVLATTGACTLPNYSDSKAGIKGEAHHVIGALIVEVQADGIYHLRHVSAGPKGDFIDLDTHYTPDGIYRARRAESLTLGDVHRPREDPQVMEATRDLVTTLRPKRIVTHDVLDFGARNHHDKGLRKAFEKRRALVQSEVLEATQWLNRAANWGDHEVIVVASNHNEAFARWLDDYKQDPENHRYWCEVWARMYEAFEREGRWPDPFALEASRLGLSERIRFLGRNESLNIKGVEHGYHGDQGINGSRGSSLSYAKLGCKTNTGHSHTPRIIDGNFTAGVTAPLDHGYNLMPSSWLNAHIHLDARGKRQMIIIVHGRYRAH
jgi:hypothetical protein